MINGKVAKASADVKVGDRIDIEFGNKNVSVEVTQIVESTKKEDAKEMFKYLQAAGFEAAGYGQAFFLYAVHTMNKADVLCDLRTKGKVFVKNAVYLVIAG